LRKSIIARDHPSFRKLADFVVNTSVFSLRAFIHEFTRFKVWLSMERFNSENSPTAQLYWTGIFKRAGLANCKRRGC